MLCILEPERDREGERVKKKGRAEERQGGRDWVLKVGTRKRGGELTKGAGGSSYISVYLSLVWLGLHAESWE